MSAETENITEVTSNYHKGHCNYFLLFGKPVRTVQLYRDQLMAKTIDYFAPDSLFCFDMWDCNRYGTLAWRVIIAKTIKSTDAGEVVKNISKAVRLLLDVEGQNRAKAAMKWIDHINKTADIYSIPESKFVAAGFQFNSMSIKKLDGYLSRPIIDNTDFDM